MEIYKMKQNSVNKETGIKETIKPETWARLNQRKAYPSQTFDTIINNLMDYEKAKIHYDLNNKQTKNDKKK